MNRVKIVTFVPPENADAVRQAVGDVGAGAQGEYSYCSYSTLGKGRFTPSADARPHIGQQNKAEVVEEERIEVACNKSDAKKVIASIKSVHPYEEVAFDIIPLFDEDDLE